MSHKKTFSVGAILLLGAGIFVAGAYAQAGRNAAGNQVQTRSQLRLQFMDEDCDGINDNFRDHDNDEIPNGKDPDWKSPKDGTGFKQRNSQNKSSFRGQGGGFMNRFGQGVCDGTGPKGTGYRRGGR